MQLSSCFGVLPLFQHPKIPAGPLLPAVSQITKIRLDKPLLGPASSHLSTTGPTGAAKHNYHFALVSSHNDVRLRYQCRNILVTRNESRLETLHLVATSRGEEEAYTHALNQW